MKNESEKKPIGYDEINFAILSANASSDIMSISPNEMYNRLDNIGLIKDFVIGCYDTSHTLSLKMASEDTVLALGNWEKELSNKYSGV